MKNDKQPEIRLPNYNESWSQRKFDDFVSKAGKKNTIDQNYMSYSVSNKVGLVSQAEQFEGSRLDNLDKTSYKIVHPGEFAYNPARINVGSIAFNNLNKIVIVSSLYVVLKMSEKLDNEFILQFIKSPNFNNEVRRNTEGSVREYLFFESFKNIKFPLPSNKDEQVEIGEFFKKLDGNIMLHQQELETLKQTKQGFLQKMFPKEGDSVPELRFPGFQEEWKKHKLEEIAEFNPKSQLPNEFEYVDLESVLGIELISHRTEKKETAPSRAQRLAEKGDVFFQTVRPYQRNNYLFDLPFDNYVFSTGYAQMRPYINSYFLLCSLQGEDFVANVLDRCTGTSYPAINSKLLTQISINVPTLKDEQIKIGNFFKQLDRVIALHQQELDALKQTKKAFLQKMFV